MIGHAPNLAGARRNFVTAAQTWRTRSLASSSLMVSLAEVVEPSGGHEDLVTDVVFLECPEHRSLSRPLVVITSGVHGVEGYAGSLLQCLALGDDAFVQAVLAHADLLFVHAVNPWGMHHRQRTDSQNIDLNRNAHNAPSLYLQKNKHLHLLRPLLAPQQPADNDSLVARSKFFATIIRIFAQLGVGDAVRSVMHGQYEFPNDLFYGGNKLSSHLGNVAQTIRGLLRQDRRCCIIDLHTGLGPKGKLTLMLSEQPNPTDTDMLQRLANQFRCHTEDRDALVRPGIFCEWLRDGLQGSREQQQNTETWRALVFEIGTLGASPWSNLTALRRLVRNNQLRHFGCVDQSTTLADEIRRQFIDLFEPSDPKWWSVVSTDRFRDLKALVLLLARCQGGSPS